MPDVFSAFVPVKPWPAILKKEFANSFLVIAGIPHSFVIL
jgi:hypothetical protein